VKEEKGERKKLNLKPKTILSTILTVMTILGLFAMFPTITFASPDGTTIEILDPVEGDHLLNYTNNEPPPTELDYPMGYVLVNVSVFDVLNLATWQINVTWDPTLLEIALVNPSCDPTLSDIYIPTDNIFNGWTDPTGLTVSSSSAFLVCGIKIGAPFDHFDGSGTLCQIKFNVTKEPSSDLSCTIHFVLAGENLFYTKLINPEADLITYTSEDGQYEYKWEAPELKKPYLEFYYASHLVEMGKPLGPSIIGTSKAFFTIDVVINDIENASMLTLIQFALVYPTDLFRLVPGIPYNATEGNFMDKAEWAPYGTDFFTNYGGIDTSGYETQYVLIMINPNDTSHEFDWGNFPDTAGYPDPADRVICSFEFEATVQEEYTWTAFVSGAFDIEYMFPSMPERMFLDANEEWIPAKEPVDGDYYIQGWIMGLMIDVYTQYPDPFGGQGLNETSDMFEPQATVKLFAELTYNADPVQNKPVVFQVVGGGGTCEDPENTTGYVNFTRVAMTDEHGVAYIEFGIPWPCSPAECEEIFGVWTVVAKATVREVTTEDWLWFKVNWLVMDLTVTPKATGFKKGGDANFTVTFCTFRLQPKDVLITLTIYDDLGVPVGTVSMWIEVGDEDIVWCTSKCYEEDFSIPLPKWAFAGEGTIYVNALTDWPFDCGVPVCPEEFATFAIIKYTT